MVAEYMKNRLISLAKIIVTNIGEKLGEKVEDVCHTIMKYLYVQNFILFNRFN